MRRTPFAIAAAIGAAVIATAFVAAPRSCEGGLEFYFGSGVVSLIVLAALPFLAALGHSMALRFLWGLGFTAFGASAWFAGLFLANVRIMCRLF